MAKRANLPLAGGLTLEHSAEEFGGRHYLGVVEPLLVERAHEPFQDVSGGLDLPLDVVVAVGRILEPLRTEGAIPVLELREREGLEIPDVAVGPQIHAVELARGLEPPLAAV